MITNRQIKAAIKIYNITGKIEDIADMWNISMPTASKILKENGLSFEHHPRSKKLPSIQREELKEDIKIQKEYIGKIGYTNLFTRQFVRWLEDKYDTKFSVQYLRNLSKETTQNLVN
jgi:hypothetical protein